MDKELNTADRATLGLELRNSTNSQQRKIRIGILTSIAGLIGTVTFYYLNVGQKGAVLILVSFTIMISGLFNIASWTIFSKSVRRLKDDLNNGVKYAGQHRIVSYNFLTKKVTLDNRFKVDSFEIRDNWKSGDQLYIEKLPTSNFILKCDKNAD